MGWCHEFGTQVHLGCDHPMTAGPNACHCDECGFVCTGKFAGCPEVWARGPRTATLLRPPEAPGRTRPASVEVTADRFEPLPADRFKPLTAGASATWWSRLTGRSPRHADPEREAAPVGVGSVSEPAPVRVATTSEPAPVGVAAASGETSQTPPVGEGEGREPLESHGPESAAEGPPAENEGHQPPEGPDGPPAITAPASGAGADWPRTTEPATVDAWYTPADWPAAAPAPAVEPRDPGGVTPSAVVNESALTLELTSGLAEIRAELLGSLDEALREIRDGTRDVADEAVAGARTELRSWLDDAFAAVRGEMRSWLNDAFSGVRSDLTRMDSDLREQQSALAGLAETVSSRLRLAELVEGMTDRLNPQSPDSGVEDASRKLEETVDEARSVLAGMQLATAAVRAELEQLTELREQLLRDAAVVPASAVDQEPVVPPALLGELAETARAGRRLGELVDELPGRIAESIADLLEAEPAEQGDEPVAPVQETGRPTVAGADLVEPPSAGIRRPTGEPEAAPNDLPPFAASVPLIQTPEPIFEAPASGAAEEATGPGLEPPLPETGGPPAPVGVPEPFTAPPAASPDVPAPSLEPGPPAEPLVPTAPPRQAPAPTPPASKSPLRRLRGRKQAPPQDPPAPKAPAGPRSGPRRRAHAGHLGHEPPVPWEPGQAPPPSLIEEPSPIEEPAQVGEPAAMDRFFSADESAPVTEADHLEQADQVTEAVAPGGPGADQDVFDVEGLLDLPLTTEKAPEEVAAAARAGAAAESAAEPTAEPPPDRRTVGDQPAPPVIERPPPPVAVPGARPRYRAKTLNRLVDTWESIMSQFIGGGLTRSPEVEPWFAAYGGEVHYDALPEPFVGSLAGRPKAVILSLNPGPAFAHLHARDGHFANEIKRTGSYAAWVANGPDPDVPYGRKSANAGRVRFVEGWLDPLPVEATDLVTFELYPWPATTWTARIDLNPIVLGLLDRYVLEPVAALRPPWVFAFGVEWFRALEGLGFTERVTVGGEHGPTWAGAAPSRVVTVFEHERKRLRVVAMRHRGSAGPPKPAEVAPLRDLLARTFKEDSAARSKPRGPRSPAH